MELKDFLINNPRQLPENAGKPLNANLRYWIADDFYLQTKIGLYGKIKPDSGCTLILRALFSRKDRAKQLVIR